jgi:hypothetical protein
VIELYTYILRYGVARDRREEETGRRAEEDVEPGGEATRDSTTVDEAA